MSGGFGIWEDGIALAPCFLIITRFTIDQVGKWDKMCHVNWKQEAKSARNIVKIILKTTLAGPLERGKGCKDQLCQTNSQMC